GGKRVRVLPHVRRSDLTLLRLSYKDLLAASLDMVFGKELRVPLGLGKADQAEIGSALSAGPSSSRLFVARFPRLLETSKTGLVPERLNKRYRVLIDNNRDLIVGKRILDLASHDGRWSLAALDLQAAHVTGIEARAHLVENAQANCLAYGIDRGRFRFIH